MIENVLIENVLAGNERIAGEFVLNRFKKEDNTILIVDDSIEIPKNVPHIVFERTMKLGDLFEKLTPFDKRVPSSQNKACLL